MLDRRPGARVAHRDVIRPRIQLSSACRTAARVSVTGLTRLVSAGWHPPPDAAAPGQAGAAGHDRFPAFSMRPVPVPGPVSDPTHPWAERCGTARPPAVTWWTGYWLAGRSPSSICPGGGRTWGRASPRSRTGSMPCSWSATTWPGTALPGRARHWAYRGTASPSTHRPRAPASPGHPRSPNLHAERSLVHVLSLVCLTALAQTAGPLPLG
jgi:hypothetical protein